MLKVAAVEGTVLIVEAITERARAADSGSSAA
jgi:hypothetical protein